MSQKLPPLESQSRVHESEMTDIPGAFAGLDRRNDAFQIHLEHNAAMPFDNDTQSDAWLLRHGDISLSPPFIIEPQRNHNRGGSLLSLRCRLHFLLPGERKSLDRIQNHTCNKPT